MCRNLQTLYTDNTGYVVRCKECKYYQVGYISTLITLTEFDFGIFIKLVEYKLEENGAEDKADLKTILIETPFGGCCLILNRKETAHLLHILESADAEYKALSLIDLFK